MRALHLARSVPVDLLVSWYEASREASLAATGDVLDDSELSAIRLTRIIRMLKLMKLARVLRASRILRRWQSHLGVSFAFMALVRFVLLTLVTAHWLACLWVIVGRLEPVPDGTPIPDAHSAFGTNWIHKAGLADATPVDLYSVALFVAVSIIFSGNSGVIVPASPFEYVVQVGARAQLAARCAHLCAQISAWAQSREREKGGESCISIGGAY